MAVGWNVGPLCWVATENVIPDGQEAAVFGFRRPDFHPTSVADVQAALDVFGVGARVVALETHDWNADPYSRGTWMAPRPGQLTRLMSALPGAEGRLHFAGADFATGWFS